MMTVHISHLFQYLRAALRFSCLLLVTVAIAQNAHERKNYVPPKGMVPNSDTATKIAEAVLVPIYGKGMVEDEKPFRVELRGDVWVIQGALHHRPGGNLIIGISKKTGCILRVIGTE